MNIIFPKRQKEIKDKFFEFSFNGIEPAEEDYKLINSPVSMHFLAYIYNWDDGEKVLDWIISNPKCDKGTALLIFWRAEPVDYTCYKDVVEADYNSGVFLLLQKIIRNFKSGFYKREKIYFDPREETDVDYEIEDSKWDIPDFMKMETIGSNVAYFPDLIELTKKWWVGYKRRRNRKRRRKKLGIK